ncbi:hypothetical protein PISMIDRAFT_680288 [Pisolithus microcarpus 441]|uniref:Uncharacterized protein n=1 Tax=Pisolithus microcarpus 441 TaxID=765257 RepID=A0A0C9YCI0_9AGAM|nr:hypothetical protein PISMIDRAFT_680288 [Pisolithus microcarpus 441]
MEGCIAETQGFSGQVIISVSFTDTASWQHRDGAVRVQRDSVWRTATEDHNCCVSTCTLLLFDQTNDIVVVRREGGICLLHIRFCLPP